VRHAASARLLRRHIIIRSPAAARNDAVQRVDNRLAPDCLPVAGKA
jgi:hypothetical protein